jgi:hypothetical protein
MDKCAHRVGHKACADLDKSLGCVKLSLKETRNVRIRYYCDMIERLRAVDHIQPSSYSGVQDLMSKWAKVGNAFALQIGQQMGLDVNTTDLHDAALAGELEAVKFFLTCPEILDELREPQNEIDFWAVRPTIKARQIEVLKLFRDYGVYMPKGKCIEFARSEKSAAPVELAVSYNAVIAWFEGLEEEPPGKDEKGSVGAE